MTCLHRFALLCAVSLPVISHLQQPSGASETQEPRDAKSLAEQLPRIPPKEPAEALESFEVLDGFKMELIASEPTVTDPVASVIDENGRMYVVEMRGYPFQKERGTDPIGRIRLLEDEDGDGVYETSSVFVDDLSWPTGIVLYDGGVFVTVAPDVWYFKDTTGDKKADVRRVVYTGFGTRNVQALLNNPKWGLDNKIYGATAGNGGEVRPGDSPDAEPLILRGQDFRFDPVTEELEATSGTAQFGNSFDDWGSRFVCSNSNHAQHVVLPNEYLLRNPYLPVPRVLNSIAADGGAGPVFRISQAEPWRIVRTARRAASGQRFAATELVPVGFFTSGSGVTIYRGEAYPEKYHGNIFVGDVGGNLVHRKTLHPNGATFIAKRADEKTEFVRSTDNWFRPVNFTNAPDGTLHVLDMYRETIEHPWSIPEDIMAHLDLESGRDRGRIYRLTPPDYKPVQTPKLGKATTEELVAYLAHPNSWQRETAHRLIFERQDKSAVAPLRELLNNGETAQARLHALYSLSGLASLTHGDLETALADTSPRIREHAIKLAEASFDESETLLEKSLAMLDDDDPRVRLQLAFSLGESSAADAVKGLAHLIKRDGGDVWFRTAALSSAAETSDDLLTVLLEDRPFAASSIGRTIANQLSQVVGVRNKPEEIAKVLAAVAAYDDLPTSLRQRLFNGLGDGLQRSGQSLGALASQEGFEFLAGLFADSIAAATDDAAPVGGRVAAVQLLGYGKLDDVRDALVEVLDPRQPSEVQLAAIRALASFRSPEVADILLTPWSRFTPPVRAEAVEALFARPERLDGLLGAIERGDVAAAQINPNRKETLLKHPNAKLKQRAEKLFGADAPSPRGDVIADYQPVLEMTGDAENGQKVFKRECLTCHKIGGEGHEVGPNLATVQNRTPADLLLHILDPNREVLPDYLDYIVLLDDGRTLTGIIAAESATSITLKRADNAQDVILRQNIEQIASTGKSLMPERMEEKISKQEMADLLEYITSLK